MSAREKSEIADVRGEQGYQGHVAATGETVLTFHAGCSDLLLPHVARGCFLGGGGDDFGDELFYT